MAASVDQNVISLLARTVANHGARTALVMQEAKTDLEGWFAALLGDALEDRATAIMTGRAAFLMCGGRTRWADQLLQPIESLDGAFIAAITDHAPSSVPPSELGEMLHQPYEAWSPSTAVFKSFQVDRGLFQGLAGLLRRDAA